MNPSIVRRFHDKNRWNSKFYSNLSLIHRTAWDLLHDLCDEAGVVEINPRVLAFHCREEAFDVASFLDAVGERIRHLEGDIFWLVEYIPTQLRDGCLRAGCNPHASAIRAVRRYNLPVRIVGEKHDQHTEQPVLPFPPAPSTSSSLSPKSDLQRKSPGRVREGLAKGSRTLKDKNKDKREDKDRIEERVQGEETGQEKPVTPPPAAPPKTPRPSFIVRRDIAEAKAAVSRARDKAKFSPSTQLSNDPETGRNRYTFAPPVQEHLDHLAKVLAGLQAELTASENAETEERMRNFAQAS